MPAAVGTGLPGLSQILSWDTTHLSQAASDWLSTAKYWEDVFTRMHGGTQSPGGTVWQGVAAEAAQERTFSDLVKVRGLADTLNDAAAVAHRGADQLGYLKRHAIDAINDAHEAGFGVGEDLSVVDASKYSGFRVAAAQQFAATIATRAAALSAADSEIAMKITAATTELNGRGFSESPETARALDFPLAPQPPREDERRHNQIDAFRRVFGRDPVSPGDWTTAAGLDPHTYDPKFQGTNSDVEVVRIKPVPGQGVVRSSQWIPDREVRGAPPWSHDLGNNRGPNPNFDPEDTKVTTIIDYDNGIVIIRQNPSVLENSDGSPGEVRVGHPSGTVTQLADGSVRIKYDSGNPFAPEISRNPSITAGHPWTVNGDLVFTPGASGVTVDGTRTDYPSMEVYQDMPNGMTRTVLIDNAAAGGQQGPMSNLPFHHDVGSGGKAFVPFNTGGWNPRYDVPTPLPGTPFGPVDNPPSAAPPAIGVPM
ncbi:hypothetical protein BayCH28_25220 [Mycolicibacterium sp. CH28]|uniref:WXG100 family type VII secretion target n=1 Tax=Mycolicibacterium sp. CH28 TaxID=2512237 RepID=UPI001080FFC9|nr:hypothetical protein [Mycolicibacterium sp. CH28]TGD84693.1 hypothetical protein BayCH28_25220 [Mycolicibacterium sp. CH28]